MTANTAGRTAAAASAARIRSAISAGYDAARGTARLAAPNTSMPPVSRRRRGQDAVTTAATGAIAAQMTEKTVTSCPAAASLTESPSAMEGSTPTITKSSVWRANAVSASAASRRSPRGRRKGGMPLR